ncbi:MAG: type II methionyl aminopeptidase [Candidatus Caldarchaeum sp.]
MSPPESLLRAGEIARKIRSQVPNLVSPGASLLEVAEKIENMIRDMGGLPAFPCNISIDAVAAHYSPAPGDSTVLSKNFVAKIDFGVLVDGYIADTAVTVTDTPVGEMLKTAVEEALKAAVKTVAAGVKVSTVAAVIQTVLTRYGLKPIRNLTGHEIQPYNLHAGVSIPNVAVRDGVKLLESHVYAIEPFATVAEGAGEVVDVRMPTIYRLEKAIPPKKLADEETRLLNIISERFKTLPYSLRWLQDLDPETLKIHERLVRMGRLKSYPMLVEKSEKPVAQAEHTVFVTREGCVVIT